MKNRIPAFISGMVTMAVLLSLVVGVMAASGMTITVNPINVQVNGEVFKPKDVNGKDVPVFNHNGTTYAPLRAMAEAFGLKVGYDAEKKMATVGEKGSATTPTTPDKPTNNWTAEEEKAYQEFKAMWDIDTSEAATFGVKLISKSSITKANFISWIKGIDDKIVKKMSDRYSDELTAQYVIPLSTLSGIYSSITSFYFDQTFLWQKSVEQIGEKQIHNINTFDKSYILEHLQ